MNTCNHVQYIGVALLLLVLEGLLVVLVLLAVVLLLVPVVLMVVLPLLLVPVLIDVPLLLLLGQHGIVIVAVAGGQFPKVTVVVNTMPFRL